MKILLLGDASNYHRCLASGLRDLGHDVTVASNGSRWMQTGRDIDISRSEGRVGGAVLWLKLNTILRSQLKGYDVVQIHNPVFADLRPHRVRELFDRLRRDNGSVFLTALGTDPQYVEMCVSKDSPLRYNEFKVGDNNSRYLESSPTIVDQWLAPVLNDYSRHVYDHIDGAVSALYEYHLSCLRHLPADMVAYGGIPVDTASIAYRPVAEDIDKINIMVACHKGREAEKGIDLIYMVLDNLKKRYPDDIELNLVQNVPFDVFQRTLDSAHIVVDQLYSYTPATTALMAMASGKVVISGAEPEYYRFIGEDELRPIINADPLDLMALEADIEALIKDKGRLAELSRQGHAFAAKHNDVMVVAQRFIDFWERRIR